MLFIFLISGDIRMNKKIKVTSAAAAALASLVLVNANVNNEVKADTKAVNDTKTTQKAQTPEEAARANVASAQKKVGTEQGNVDKAQGDLDQAKKDAEKPDADYKAQSDKVDGLKKTVDQKNEALTDAKNKEKDAQALADEAKDPAKVGNAKDAVTKQKDVVKGANKAKDAADQAVKTKQGEIDGLKGKVQSDTTDVAKKTTAKEQADQAVKTAEDDLKGTGITEAKKKLDNANEAVEKTQKALKEANKAIEQANGDKTRAQTALATAQSAHATAVTNQKIAQKTYDDAKAASDAADKKLADKKAEIKDLENKKDRLEVNNQNQITIPNVKRYESLFGKYMKNPENPSFTSADIHYLDLARSQNKFISSEADKNISVDLNNLTDEQIKDLSLFALSLTNKLRAQFGWDPEVVTDGSIKIAKEVAQKYKEDFKNTIPDWHDDEAINDSVKSHNIGLGEAMQSSYIYNARTNMDSLKHDIFDMFNGMIFSKGNGIDEKGGKAHYELGHAMVLIGGIYNTTDNQIISRGNPFLNDWKEQVKNCKTCVNRLNTEIAELQQKEQTEDIKTDIQSKKEDIEKYQSKIKKTQAKINECLPLSMALIPTDYGYDSRYYADPISYHYLSAEPDKDSVDFSEKIIPSYASQIKEVNSKLNQANYELPGLKSEAERLDGITSGKSTNLNNKNTAVGDAQNSIDKANNAIKKANNTLISAQGEKTTQAVQLEKDKKAQEDAKTHYENLTADNQAKTKKLEEAKAAQENAAQELQKAKDTLTQVKKDLDQAQKDLPTLKETATEKGNTVKTEQGKLDQLKQHVEDLKNAATILADAKKAVASAQTAYDTAKKNYEDANEVLNGDLKTNKEKADAKVAAAQKAYDDAYAKLQAAKDALAKAQQKLQDILDAEYAQSIITSGPVETKKTNKQEPVKTPEATSETKTDDISTAPKKIRLTHNAFVYNMHGKLVRKGLHIKWIKRDKLVKVLKNAKIVKINGKRYYQIGKNQFIKVANTKLTTHKVHIKVRIKGNKKIKMYNRSGKFNKHYARPNHTYTFNEKAKIHGKTYYKIAGTNNWIPAKKLAL